MYVILTLRDGREEWFRLRPAWKDRGDTTPDVVARERAIAAARTMKDPPLPPRLWRIAFEEN